MDLPITIIVVLFVSLIVGVTLIQFARNVILDAGEKIENEENLERVIELQSVNPKQIAFLAEDCLNIRELDKELCFVIHFKNSFDAGANVGSIVNEWTNEGNDIKDLDVTGLKGNVNAIFIYNNPAGYVEITN